MRFAFKALKVKLIKSRLRGGKWREKKSYVCNGRPIMFHTVFDSFKKKNKNKTGVTKNINYDLNLLRRQQQQ